MTEALINDCWSKPWNLALGTHNKKSIYPMHTEVSLGNDFKKQEQRQW